MLFSFITIHPKLVESYGELGVFRAAQDKGLAKIQSVNLRDFGVDRRGSIDDLPYGGGDGMIMRPEPLAAAVRSLCSNTAVVMPTPTGQLFNHHSIEKLLRLGRPLAFVCGRFGGVDQRFVDTYVDYEFSLGDFIVSGGELPALMMLDGILRQIPGVLGDPRSASYDSFGSGFNYGLEHPQYTRPPSFEGHFVPDVLRSGDHDKIASWKKQESKHRTARLRPDLLDH